MKASLILFSLILTGSAFAISDEKLVEMCMPPAIEEIQRLNESRGCTIVDDKVILVDIDNRRLSPSKYLRFEYLQKCEDGEIRQGIFIAQYFNKKCYVSNF